MADISHHRNHTLRARAGNLSVLVVGDGRRLSRSKRIIECFGVDGSEARLIPWWRDGKVTVPLQTNRAQRLRKTAEADRVAQQRYLPLRMKNHCAMTMTLRLDHRPHHLHPNHNLYSQHLSSPH